MTRKSVSLTMAVLLVAACGSDGGGPPTGGATTGTIAGQVVDADSGNGGVPGVTVQLVGPAGNQSATTNATGAYTLGSAAPGSWQLTVQVPATHLLATGEAGTRSATVNAGQTANVSAFTLARPKGGIEGTAESGNTVIAGGTVAATRSGFSTVNATPSASGYTMTGLAVGAWTLTYTPPVTHVLADGEAGTRAVTVAAGATANPSAFQLAPAPPQAAVVEIRLNGMTFSPSDITIAPGTTVRWINEDGQPHTVTPQNATQVGGFSRQTTESTGTVFEHTFNTPNQTYRYRCEPHSTDFDNGMVGVIRVSS